MTITVCVPTIGRPTLARALKSCDGADEVLVDYNQDGDNGYAARNRMLRLADSTNVAFMDDDDVFTPGALELMRGHACDKLVIFQMRYLHGLVLWNKPYLMYGNVGSPMILCPNRPELWDAWKGHDGGTTGGDYEFARTAADLLGPPVFVEHVVALIRPN